MASNYETITENNIKCLGTDTSSRSSQVSMYSDFTHFIFEILQNADDYGATEISFDLSFDRLEIVHNGDPFISENVKAISYFGKSTSREDLVKAGRFGLGFKSVFAFTATPAIHSGDEHFEIYDLYKLRAIKCPEDFPVAKTKIILPFDHLERKPNYVDNSISPKMAYKRISERLEQLDIETLLFTLNIREIQWRTKDKKGHYLREDESEIQNEIRKTTITDGINLDKYLIFSRQVIPPKDQFKEVEKCRPVDLAFKLDEHNSIVYTKRHLTVLFETKEETHAGFIINGLFRTPPHRETVNSGDSFNQFLMSEISVLLVKALNYLSSHNLLTVEVLKTLPIQSDDFPIGSIFLPIFEDVKKALQNQPLLPSDDGKYVCAKQAKLARGAELRELLKEDQLKALFEVDETVAWISGEITYDKTRPLRDYLLNELGVEEIDAEAFARKITERFIEKQSDDWVVQFYQFLIGQEALWRESRSRGDTEGLLRKKPIIRTQDGRHMMPNSGNIYLPPETGETNFMVVKREIVADEDAREFLRKLGIEKIDIIVEIIEEILPKYCNNETQTLSKEDHQEHIEKIVQAVKTDSQVKRDKLMSALKETPFIRAINLEGLQAYKMPSEVYFCSDDLKLYFRGCSDAWFLDDIECLDLWKELGIEDKVREKRSIDKDNYGNVRLPHYWNRGPKHQRGLKGFDPDFSIDRLDVVLKQEPSVDRARLIWNKLVIPNSSFIRGIVEKSGYQNFSSPTKSEEYFSKFGELLAKNRWLPNQKGEFFYPIDLSLEDLPDEFDRNHQLAQQLNMKSDVLKAALEDAGIPLENQKYIELLRNLNQDQRRQLDDLLQQKVKPQFPSKPVADPQRRQEKILELSIAAPERDYEQKSRSVRTSQPNHDPKPTLKNYYTNNLGQLICQICEEEMPFKKRDGEYYFEVVECFDKKMMEEFGLIKEVPELYLALCPICAAKFQEYIKRDPNKMDKFLEAIKSAENELSISFQLDMPEIITSVRFVEKHLHDIRVILKDKSYKKGLNFIEKSNLNEHR